MSSPIQVLYQSLERDCEEVTFYDALELKEEPWMTLPLYYIKGKQAESLGTWNQLDTSKILELSTVAPFGDLKTNETVVNKDVRHAQEIPLKHMFTHYPTGLVKVQFPPNLLKNQLATSYRLEPYKMTIYEEGGFFKSHTDTCTSNTFIGSLVVGVSPPGSYEGGELVVRHRGKHVSFQPTLGNAIFFYGNCEHEVKPVTRGVRLALVYKVFSMENVAEELRMIGTLNTQELFQSLVDLVQYKYCGQTMEFQMTHQYGGKPTLETLKGLDYNLCTIFQKNFGIDSVSIEVEDFSKYGPVDGNMAWQEGPNDCRETMIFLSDFEDNLKKAGEDYSGYSGNEASHVAYYYFSYFLNVEVPLPEDTDEEMEEDAKAPEDQHELSSKKRKLEEKGKP